MDRIRVGGPVELPFFFREMNKALPELHLSSPLAWYWCYGAFAPGNFPEPVIHPCMSPQYHDGDTT
jgi:hypothetical protein